jgi:arginyl-tRNA synthetase
MRAALAAGPRWGRLDVGVGKRLVVEFVSADPTGPLTLLHGRGAALGAALAGLMEWAGYQVCREFYVNDTPPQLARLGRAVAASDGTATGAALPEAGPLADYVAELAAAVRTPALPLLALPENERAAALGQLAGAEVLRRQQATLARFGIPFDSWYSERSLHESGKVSRVVASLQQAGHVYEADGALWLRSSQFGDAKDRPLVRSNGLPTYIAADLAYHLDRFHRGFHQAIDVWGPDYADYVARTRAGLLALGIEPERLEVIIFQPVTLRVDDIPVEGAELKSEGIWLDGLLEVIAAPVARLLYLARAASQPLELNLDVGRTDAPITLPALLDGARVQAAALMADAAPAAVTDREWAALDRLAAGPGVVELARQALGFPAVVRAAVEQREPWLVLDHARKSALQLARVWFERTKLTHGPGHQARAAVAAVADLGMRNALTLLGVSAPERN